MRNLRLEGKYVYLDEVQPKYFTYIIEWRNNPENNRFLNQPFKLTMELQNKWYEEKYLKDFSQGLFVVVDKKNNIPFATLGWTDYDKKQKILISGRALVGNYSYRGSKEFLEAMLLISDFFYKDLKVDNVYAHIVNENFRSIMWHRKWGFVLNDGVIKFPNELLVNGMEQKEYIRSRYDYENVRKVMVNKI